MNEKEELFNEIIDVPNKPQPSNTSEQNNFNYNFNFETQTKEQSSVDDISINKSDISSNNNLASPEIEILDINSIEETVSNQKEKILEDLNRDTDNFVNPNLIVNPNVKKAEEKQKQTNIEEPKVDYEKINNKKKLVFMIIIFAIIIVFIIFLPQIVSLLDF